MALHNISNLDAASAPIYERPFLRVNFSGVTRQLLIDTGATISALETGFFLSIPNSAQFPRAQIPRNFAVTAASGGHLKLRALVDIPLQVGKLQTRHKFLIVDNLSSTGILGMDFLSQNDFQVNCTARSITRHSEKFDFQGNALDCISALQTCKPDSFSTKKLFFPPHSSQVIKLTVPKKSTRAHKMGYISAVSNSPLAIIEGVHRVKHGCISVIAVNPSPLALRIPAEEGLGHFQPVFAHQISSLGSVVDKPTFDKIIPPLTLEKKRFLSQNVKISCPPNIRTLVINLLEEFHDVVSSSPTDLGGTDLISHKVHLKTDVPVHTKQFPIPLANEEFILQYVKDLLDKDVIEPSLSPYNSPIFVVPKPHGGRRIVLDFRNINKITFQDKYIVRTVQSCIDQIGYMNAKIFTSLDLTSGFWQQNLDPNSRQFSAFTVPGNMRYQWKRCPMGMVGSSHSFARLIDYIFRDCKFVLGYIDDLLCCSSTFEEHLIHLRQCFELLRKHNLKLQSGYKLCSFLW